MILACLVCTYRRLDGDNNVNNYLCYLIPHMTNSLIFPIHLFINFICHETQTWIFIIAFDTIYLAIFLLNMILNHYTYQQ